MILRTIGLVFALAGGLTATQVPGFAQQYVQRLGGAVDALETVVEDFDSAASQADLSRSEALAALSGSDFLDQRQQDMRQLFARYNRLHSNLLTVSDAGPFLQSYLVLKSADPVIARAAFLAYRPSMPLDAAGLVFGLLGGAAGFAVGRGLGWFLPRGHRRPA